MGSQCRSISRSRSAPPSRPSQPPKLVVMRSLAFGVQLIARGDGDPATTKTGRVTLGTNVLAATFRHPGLMAKMARAVQELSGGRFILGIGAGNQTPEQAAFGPDFEHRIGRFKEYLPIMTELLAGQTVTFAGRYFTLNEASLRTVVPFVPIWVAAGGPQMFELTARYGHGWNMAGGGTRPETVREKYDKFASACRAVGREATQFDVA